MMHSASSKKVGIEFSDTMLRFVSLKQERSLLVPFDYAHISIPEGCLRDGKVTDEKRFVTFLKKVRKTHGITAAYIALPQDALRLVSGLLDTAVGTPTTEALKQLLQTKTKLDPSTMTYEKSLVLHSKKGRFMQLLAASTTVTEQYLRCFIVSGITPMSFEHSLQSLVNAVIPKGQTQSALVVVVGEYNTQLCIVVNECVVDTLTLDEGAMVTPGQYSTTLVAAINQYYIDWHTNKTYSGVVDTIKTVYLSGTALLIPGYADYISAAVKLPVFATNTWTNCFSFEDIIPRLTFDHSIEYAVAVGLALGRGSLSVLPHKHKRHLKRKKYLRMTGVVLLSFAFGVLAGLLVATVLFLARATPHYPVVLHKIALWW